jgi:hypothetical protein
MSNTDCFVLHWLNVSHELTLQDIRNATWNMVRVVCRKWYKNAFNALLANVQVPLCTHQNPF